ncbi:virulence protein RhuM/Fic/DOC family protein [uncultured Christiangramia sp.]|uniref:virulence protein RhuM/Fic/DOC family protein n=1 Tax=Christiangramia sp. 3-2217-3z TaxID=3417564 RepID=UPI0026284BBA|nr:virulence protein RhuM/Fic/DOC family protein [uncultured Christiangramia sp.]
MKAVSPVLYQTIKELQSLKSLQLKMMSKTDMNETMIFQAENGALEIRSDIDHKTVWATQDDLSFLYGKDQSVISRHIRNILKDKEVDKKSNMQKMHIPNSDKRVNFYSLDIILAVGYRTNSARAIQFRKWANEILKQHIEKGFTINQNQLEKNKIQFLHTLENLKILSQNNTQLEIPDVLSLIQNFSDTWFSLDQFDKNEFPKKGTKEEIQLSANDLQLDLGQLKIDLIKKGEATELFAQEKSKGNLEGIVGTVFQTVFGEDAYPTIEEKAAHLIYFVVKNHPFNDGNKRSGAFAFIWLLQKAGVNFTKNISPETLTTLTLLIAQSDPKEKDKMIGVVLLLLNSDQKSPFSE